MLLQYEQCYAVLYLVQDLSPKYFLCGVEIGSRLRHCQRRSRRRIRDHRHEPPDIPRIMSSD